MTSSVIRTASGPQIAGSAHPSAGLCRQPWRRATENLTYRADVTFDGRGRLDAWLNARDGETLARAWAPLRAVEVPLAPGMPRAFAPPKGVAHLVGAFLGCSPEQFEWFEGWQHPRTPPPVFDIRRTVRRCFLDGTLDSHHECVEHWELHEVTAGTRGLQYLQIVYSYDLSEDRGSSRNAVRIFDRRTSSAVSIPIYSTSAWMIGVPIDLTPLLFTHEVSFKLPWTRYDLDAARGLIAQLTADLDAHFDTSPSWSGGVTATSAKDESWYTMRKQTHRFESGAFAVELEDTEQTMDFETGKTVTHTLVAAVHGLPWGHEVSVRLDSADDPRWGVTGTVKYTVPRDQLAAALARLAGVPGIEVQP
jgi:hypothetical protein